MEIREQSASDTMALILHETTITWPAEFGITTSIHEHQSKAENLQGKEGLARAGLP